MSKKNKHYGFPYDYSNKKPLYKFRKDHIEMTFYSDGRGFAMVQKTADHQQRVTLNDVSLNNMLSMLDKNGFQQIAI